MIGMGGGGGVHMFMWGQRGDAAKKRPTVAMYRRLLRFVGPYRGNLGIAVVLLLVSTALGLVWPKIVQRVLDLGLKEPGLLDELVVIFVVVLLVRAVVDGVRQFVMAWTGEKVIFDLRMAIVNHLQSMSLSFFNVRKTGDLMSHVTSDATLVHGVVTQTIIDRARVGAIMFPAIGFLGFASSIVVLWYGGHQVASGELTAGELVAFLLYMGMVAGPVGGLASQWTGIQQAFGAADRIFALL